MTADESNLARKVLSRNGLACDLWASAFARMLFEGDAANYIEYSIGSDEYPGHGQIVVTVQRHVGETPHQLRIDAENQLKTLQNLQKMPV